MNERLRAAGRWLADSPGAHVVLGASILAIAFPRYVSGSLGLMALSGALGVGIAMYWPSAPAWMRRPPADFTATLVVTLVVAVGVTAFWETLTQSPDWQMGDWGPQRTALSHLMPSLPGTGAPTWDHTVSTGDAPFELYPSLAYFVTGHVALLLGLRDDLSLALMIVGVLVHIAIAVGTTLIAMKLAPRPVALVIGILALVDSGAVAHGGTVGLFRWALLHSALALAFSIVAAVGIVSALRRPRLASSIAIWVGTALATATHPAGLLSAAAALLGLTAVALLASDIPPRRAFVAMGHVLLGLALGAFVWMPLAARILAYGEHFPNGLRTPAKLLEDLAMYPSPVTAFAILSYAGFIGIIAGLWSRRGPVVFVAATALVLIVGLCDAPYLAFDLTPGRGVARLGVERLAQLARPFLAAAGAYTIALVLEHIHRAWQGASTRRRLIAAAIIGILSGGMLRALPTFWRNAAGRASAEARVLAPDPGGREALTRWARIQMRTLKPGAWARALFDEDTHEQMHLTAETGLPTFHMGPLPDMLLRERIEDTTPASLQRFNVRWVIGIGRSPAIGNPATEITLGNYHVREIDGWDGKFARVERGTGDVVVTRLDAQAVDIDVTAKEPVLVVLGTGFYPRWRATHASGVGEPVYAYPTIPGGKLHVVAAWVAPGHTTFTVDAPLPSDHDGLAISILALVLALTVIVVWRVPRWRTRVLRGALRIRRRIPLAKTLRFGVPVIILALVVRGAFDWKSAAKDLGVGSGIRALATVEARPYGGEWQECGYSRVTGEYRCPGLATVYDATANLLNDAEPSWAFVTPAIAASAETTCEIRIWLRAHLSGTYWAAVNSGVATFQIEGDQPRQILRHTALTFEGDDEATVSIQATVTNYNWQFVFVRADTLVPDRPFLAPPPDAAPASVRAIR